MKLKSSAQILKDLKLLINIRIKIKINVFIYQIENKLWPLKNFFLPAFELKLCFFYILQREFCDAMIL